MKKKQTKKELIFCILNSPGCYIYTMEKKNKRLNFSKNEKSLKPFNEIITLAAMMMIVAM